MNSARASLIVCVLFAAAAARAQSNLVLLISPSGEYIGAGQTYLTTNQSDIGISGTAATVTITAFGFFMNFDAPGSSELTVGLYSNVVRYSFNGDSPGLSVHGNGRACNDVCGSFQVHEIQANGAGQVVHFWATFSQRCGCDAKPPLTGEIRYDSQLAPPSPSPRILRVPGDFPTIQGALNNVNPLAVETVLVEPGLYLESVQFGNTRARLTSLAGPGVTLIMAPSGSAAVTFGGTTADALLCGFTLTNSTIGVSVSGAGGPMVVSNIIVGCETGISCGGGSPTIRSNMVIECSGVAVQLSFTTSALVEGNRFERNGGGIGMWQAGAPDIRNNVIRGNLGDGLSMANYCNANIIQNLITENGGNGITWLVPLGGRGPWVMNNSIVGNGGTGISADGYDGASQIINNIVAGEPALWVGSFNDTTPPVVEFNNIYSATGAAYSGLITNLTGIAGNISSNPFFTCQPGGDFHLLPDSQCIDAGTGAAPLLLATDLDGRVRIIAGLSNGPAVVDMGAFEFDPSTPPLACLFLICPSDIVVIAPPGQNSTVVSYPPAFATPGAVVTNFPSSGSVFPVGDNMVSVTAVYGNDITNCQFTISVLTTDDIASGVNTTNVTWVQSGDSAWFIQDAVTRDGLAAQSGAITNDQSSILQTSFSGPGSLSFWWKVSSEANHDLLSLKVNGTTQTALSGATGWQPQTVYLGSGPQLVEWTYAKDASGSAGQDAAWLDQVGYALGATAPALTSPPTSCSPISGRNATFSVTAVGTPPLSYQWRFNGASIEEATNATLVITNVQASDVGIYSVVVTNLGGVTNSADAMLTLAEVVAWNGSSYGETNVPPNSPLKKFIG